MIILSKPDEISCLRVETWATSINIHTLVVLFQGSKLSHLKENLFFLRYHVSGQRPGVELTTTTLQLLVSGNCVINMRTSNVITEEHVIAIEQSTTQLSVCFTDTPLPKI